MVVYAADVSMAVVYASRSDIKLAKINRLKSNLYNLLMFSVHPKLVMGLVVHTRHSFYL